MSDTVDNNEPQENLKPLKMLVLSMGLIMIGGVVMLAGMVWKKVSAQTSGTGAYACAGGEADLKGRGTLLRMERDGKQLFVTFEKGPQQVEVATVDLCSGAVKSSVVLAVDGQKKL